MRIQVTSRHLAELDVLSTYAVLADRHSYVEPEIVDTPHSTIVRGRHPVVEQIVGNHVFVPNDLRLELPTRTFAVLTGPNMGGKSTYLRQVGLIQLLAQAGSFVPAEKAQLGVVDTMLASGGYDQTVRLWDGELQLQLKDASFKEPIPLRLVSDGTIQLLAQLRRTHRFIQN